MNKEQRKTPETWAEATAADVAAVEAYEAWYVKSVGLLKSRIYRLQEENAALKERLRPRHPETEPPPDNRFVIVLERTEGPADTACYYFAAHRIRSKWRCTSSGWVVYPVAWWPVPDNEGSEI